MYFLIDNSSTESVAFFWGLDGNWIQHSFPTDKGLLEIIALLFRKENLSFEDLEGVAVVIGSGRFTAVRIAVTIANTLALALGIPVVGVKTVDLHNLSEVISKTVVGQYISPQYSAPPHIGGKV